MAVPQNLEGVTYSGEGSFKDIWGALRRQYPIILLTIVACLALTAIVGFLIPKAYQSQATFYIEGRTQASQMNNAPESMTDLTDLSASYDIITQIQRLKSGQIARTTWDKVGIRHPGIMDEQAMEQLPSAKAEQQNQSNVVGVTVTGPNEKDVLAFITELPTVFSEDMQNQQKDATDKAVKFMDAKIKDKQAELDKINTDLSALKSKSQVVDGSITNAAGEPRLQDLQVQAANAKATSDSAKLNADKARADYTKVPDTVNQPIVQVNELYTEAELKLQELERQRTNLLSSYTEDNPDVKAVNLQISSQQARLKTIDKTLKFDHEIPNPEKLEFHRILADAEQKQKNSEANYREINATLQQRLSAHPAVLDAVVQEGLLEQKVKEKEADLQLLQQKAIGVDLKQNNIRVPLKVLTPANRPKLVRPDWWLWLPAAALMGLILGSVFAVARDNINDRVINGDAAEVLTGVPLLATVPRRKRSGNPAIDAHYKAVSFEGYRLLRTNLMLMLGAKHPKQILFTSMVPGEGTSVVSANLATACAAAGMRTIYVDTNFRRPSGANLFGLAADCRGLAEALGSSGSVREFLSSCSTPGLQVLAAGTIPASIGEALASPRMKQIVDELGAMAEVVIFDTTAFLGAADSVALASAVGNVVVVIVPGVAPKAELKEFSEMMRLGQVNYMGFVLNKTEPSSVSDAFVA